MKRKGGVGEGGVRGFGGREGALREWEDAINHTAFNRGRETNNEKKREKFRDERYIINEGSEKDFLCKQGRRKRRGRRGKRRCTTEYASACGQLWMGRKNNGPTHPSLSLPLFSLPLSLFISLLSRGGRSETNTVKNVQLKMSFSSGESKVNIWQYFQ